MISDDFPAFERPKKAYSGKACSGNWCGATADFTKRAESIVRIIVLYKTADVFTRVCKSFGLNFYVMKLGIKCEKLFYERYFLFWKFSKAYGVEKNTLEIKIFSSGLCLNVKCKIVFGEKKLNSRKTPSGNF